MAPLRLLAPAKLNLGLEVTGRRPDGYHELVSLMVNINLSDELTLTPGSGFEVSGPYAVGAGDPTGNLAALALAGLGEFDSAPLAMRLELVKRIPPGAGLGGGSADCAALLRAAAALGVEATRARLDALALRLGADVPYQLHGGTALVTGLGEEVRRLPHLDAHVAVAWRTACSTAEVFGALEEADWSDGGEVHAAAEAIIRGADRASGADAGQVATLIDDLPNQLLAAAGRRFPALLSDLGALEEAGWRPRLTGSGGAFYQLAGESSEARDLAAAARRAGFAAWACRTLPAPAD